MLHNFSELVEEVRQLSLDEKEELQSLLSKFLIEERRKDMLANHRASLREVKAGRLKFSADLNDLEKSLSDD